MPITVEQISEAESERVIRTSEGQFSDVKSIDISPAKLTRHASALANSDGGNLYVGIEELDTAAGDRQWRGFSDQEAANGHLQVLEELFPLGADFQYEFLSCDQRKGLVLHLQINKTQKTLQASNGIPYVRRGRRVSHVTPTKNSSA